MTDNEIIKALEEWRKELIADYQRLQLLGAPMDCFEESHGDTVSKLSNALDLINRQKAEIEKLETEIDKQYEQAKADILGNMADGGVSCHWCIEEHRANAIKEFAERLKEKAWHGIWETINHVDVDEIDNLVKKMVGDNNEG